MSRESLKQRIDDIERSYEFLLAYAAQGLRTDRGAKTGGELRHSLETLEKALDGLADGFRDLLEAEEPESGAELPAFLDVLEADQRSSLAAVRLVAGQSAIGSRLVDNLNASIHLRALLTDVFLLDEILRVLGEEAMAAGQEETSIEEPSG
jgi:hypothetical protein